MVEEENNFATPAWIIETPRPPKTGLSQSVGDPEFAHTGANLDITDAISCHFSLHSVMDAAFQYPLVEEFLASLMLSWEDPAANGEFARVP